MGDYDIWLDANFDNKIVESWFELRKDKKARSIVLARDEIKNMKGIGENFLKSFINLLFLNNLFLPLRPQYF